MRCFVLSVVLGSWVWAALGHPDLDVQIAAVTRRIEQEPTNATLHLRRGELYRIHGEWERALTDYDRAERLGVEARAVDLARGLMWLEAGKLADAERVLVLLIQRNPRDGTARELRARVLVQCGQPARAIEELTLAITNAPTPAVEWYVERARLQSDTPAIALAGLVEGTTRLGFVPALELPALDLEIKLRRYDDALARLHELAQHSPRQETWLSRRGDVLLLAGRVEEARAAYRTALAAVERLPVARRQVPAMIELTAELQTKLVNSRRLDAPQ
jgi:predicted Zn-dependent protease